MQWEWIVKALNQQRDEGLDTVEANQAEDNKWRKEVQDLAMILVIFTNSWYVEFERMLSLIAVPTTRF